MLRLHLYKTVEGCPSGLSPIERQLAALITSELNATPHCSSGLHLKLLSLGADRELLRQVSAHPKTARSGNARLDAIIAHAVKLTLHPGQVDAADVDRL